MERQWCTIATRIHSLSPCMKHFCNNNNNNIYNISYAERLRLLNLDTLEVRRLKFDLIYCYKMVFGLLCVKCDNFFVMATISHQRSYPFKLFKGFSTSTRSSFFSERLINRWNRLPDSVAFTSLIRFKRSLSNIDLILDYLVKLLTRYML